MQVESPSEFYVIRTSDEPRLEEVAKAVISCQKYLRRIRPKEDNLDAGEGLLVLIDGGGVFLRARVEKVGRNQRRQFEKIAVCPHFSIQYFRIVLEAHHDQIGAVV